MVRRIIYAAASLSLLAGLGSVARADRFLAGDSRFTLVSHSALLASRDEDGPPTAHAGATLGHRAPGHATVEPARLDPSPFEALSMALGGMVTRRGLRLAMHTTTSVKDVTVMPILSASRVGAVFGFKF